MSLPALDLEGLRKTFRIRRGLADTLRHPFDGSRITALDSISCQLPEGEFFGVLGENGAGKTTLFKILSTLALPDAGRAAVFGVDVARDPSRVRQIVAPVLANERSLSWRLSASENLRLYAALHRLRRSESQRRISELLEVVGLADVGARMAGTFSSGMKQRLLLARALVARPRMLLLDEPTRSLDPVAARSFRDFLRRDIGRTRGCTVLLATHDPEEVRDLCDRVGVLHRGRLVAMGTTGSLAAQLGYHRYRLITTEPRHPVVEQLVGDGARLWPPEAAEGGWHRRDLDLPDTGDPTTGLVTRLVSAGVPVARFERIDLPLADLIERLADRAERGAHA
jgi:ABC-2 type transport system ATP-binding protein